MKHNYSFRRLALIVFAGVTFVACSDDPSQPGSGTGGEPVEDVQSYVIAATEGDAAYLLTAESLFEGTVSTVGEGLTTETASYWPIVDNYMVALRYAQGEATITNTYYLDAATSTIKMNPTAYTISRLTSYGTYGDYIITSGTADLANEADAAGQVPQGIEFTFMNMLDGTTTTNSVPIYSENFLGNGEYVTLTGVLESGGRLFTAPVPMGLSQYGVDAEGGRYVIRPELVTTEAGGSNSSAYDEGELQWTQYPNEAWLAIYNSAEDVRNGVAPTLVKDERISFAAGRSRSQYFQMIWKDDQSNVYMFSPSYAKTQANAVQRTTLPAGVIRMPAGSSSFDSYYVNIEELSGGRSFVKVWPAGGDNFLLLMYDAPIVPGQSAPSALSLAIFNAGEQTLTDVTGLPSSVSSFANSAWEEDGYVHIPVNTSDGQFPAIYNIDVETAVATKGLEIQTTTVSGLGKLNGRL